MFLPQFIHFQSFAQVHINLECFVRKQTVLIFICCISGDHEEEEEKEEEGAGGGEGELEEEGEGEGEKVPVVGGESEVGEKREVEEEGSDDELEDDRTV